MKERDLVDKIIAVLAEEAGLKDSAELLKRTATGAEHRIVKFRDDAIYLAREATKESGLSLIVLGEWFGARSHTTLISACRRVALRLERNPPRRDKRKWTEWHAYIMEQVNSEENAQ
jgi:chromosomal replication initiation ATPase DnaA